MRRSFDLVILILLLLAQSACGAQPLATETQEQQINSTDVLLATAQEPTSTLETTASLNADLIERVLTAVDELNEPDGFSYEARATTLTKTTLVSGGETLNYDTRLESMVDRGAWLLHGAQANITLKRDVSFPGSDLQSLVSEIRLIDRQVFLRAAYKQPRTDLPVLPDGWLRLNGISTLLYWPNTRDLSLEYVFQNLYQDPWALISGYPANKLDGILSNHLENIQQEATALPDGSPGEMIVIAIKSSGLTDSIRYLDKGDPGYMRAIATVQGNPISMEFSLDETGQLVAWALDINFEVKDVDFSGISGAPQGSHLDGRFEQTVSVQLSHDAALSQITAPDESEMSDIPILAGSASGAPIHSLEDFDVLLNQAISGASKDTFWDELAQNVTMPLVFGDLAVFLYRGENASVNWVSDWGYSRVTATERLESSNMWMHTVHLPTDARLEYQIQLDGDDLILDPCNPLVETGGLGSKSVVEMPDYTDSDFVNLTEGILLGSLSEDMTLFSQNLGYEVNFRVYTPAGYENLERLPVVYVTDGQDFLAFGKLAVALDNLIAEGAIRPVMAVFIDPRDVKTGENQRDQQFFDSPQYGRFIVEELVPHVDQAYRTDPSPDSRLIIGTSNGGYHSLYFALNHSDTFHLITAFSPSLWHNPEIIDTYRKTDVLPLKFFITTGVFNDNDYYTRIFQQMLAAKGYPLEYIESNEGHSYGNWRGKFDEMLAYFFSGERSE